MITYRYEYDPFVFHWNGAHTINIYLDGEEIDVISLNYGRDDYTVDEFREAAEDWVYEKEKETA